MKNSMMTRFSLVAALAAALVAVPADAQGRGKGQKDRERPRPELIRRDDDRRETRREDRDNDVYDILNGRVDDRDGDRRGPPFCRNGEGHPVHGRQWCIDRGFGLGGSGVLFDDRYERRDGRYEDSGRYGSYEEAHAAFHRELDRWYQMRAAERPLDVQYQLRLRAERNRRHDEWHARMGRSH